MARSVADARMYVYGRVYNNDKILKIDEKSMILEILRYNKEIFIYDVMNLSRFLFEILRYYFAIDGLKFCGKFWVGKLVILWVYEC